MKINRKNFAKMQNKYTFVLAILKYCQILDKTYAMWYSK